MNLTDCINETQKGLDNQKEAVKFITDCFNDIVEDKSIETNLIRE